MEDNSTNQWNVTAGLLAEEEEVRRPSKKRKLPPLSGLPSSSPMAKQNKNTERSIWWNKAIDDSKDFFLKLTTDVTLNEPLQNAIPGQIVRLPFPPAGGLTSRFSTNKKMNNAIPVIQRNSFALLQKRVQEKGGLVHVSGPHGVGKSFALYHLYCALSIVATNRVMYIPNCAQLNQDPFSELTPALVAAFAQDEHFLHSQILPLIDIFGEPLQPRSYFKYFASHCADNGLTFYAIFDQHNSLKAKQRTKIPTDLFTWPEYFPNSKIIVSASNDNEDIVLPKMVVDDLASYWFAGGYSNQPDIPEFAAWQSENNFFLGEDVSIVSDITSNIPCELDALLNIRAKMSGIFSTPKEQLRMVVLEYRNSRSKYFHSSHQKYLDNTNLLRTDDDHMRYRTCLFRAAYHIPLGSCDQLVYDRQLFYDQDNSKDAQIFVEPCTPIAGEVAIRILQSHDLRLDILSVVSSSAFTNDAKSRAIKAYVIHQIAHEKCWKMQFHRVGSALGIEKYELDSLDIIYFYGNKAPHQAPSQNTLFVPLLADYPEIDFFIWNHAERILYAFQVATGTSDYTSKWASGETLYDAWNEFLPWKTTVEIWVTALPLHGEFVVIHGLL
jgi:hypothetical protein